MNLAPSSNPNAIYGGLVAGSGAGSIVAWLFVNVFHWDIPAAGSAAIAGGIAFVVLYIGREGIVPSLKRLLFGGPKKT